MNTSLRHAFAASLLVAMIATPMTLLAATPQPMHRAAQTEGSRDLMRYERAAQPEVAQIQFTHLEDWQALDGSTVVVWTANDKPWLVHVDGNCQGLEHTSELRLTSANDVITANTDAVEVGSQRCVINKIQPVDYKQVAHSHRHPVHAHKTALVPQKP